jgi:hypothetical protein
MRRRGMRNNKYYKIVLLLAFIISGDICAQKNLNIPPYVQGGFNSCWAAVSYMVLNAYGASETEMDIRRWAFPPNGTDLPNFFTGHPNAVDKILEHFGSNHGYPNGIESVHIPRTFYMTEAIGEINAGRPILAARRLIHGFTGHAYLIVGYTGNGIGSNVGDILINDPLVDITMQIPYSSFAIDPNWFWHETLALTTNPITTPCTFQPTTFSGTVTANTTVYGNSITVSNNITVQQNRKLALRACNTITITGGTITATAPGSSLEISVFPP